MKLQSPIAAMLWEHWRLSRVEAALRLVLGIVAGSAALSLLDAGAAAAFWILIVLHGYFYFSIAKLNGGRFIDGYKPGFPLYLLYTRPVSTAMFVGVAMAYDAFSCAALYVISAAFLEVAFGQQLPLFSAAVCIVTFHFVSTCIQWSTRSRVIQWIGSMVAFWPFLLLLINRVAPPRLGELSLTEIALMVLVSVVSFGLTVAGVVQQRCGGATASASPAGGSAEIPEWLISLFRFPCPTSSATRAQVWFELRSSGLPVLMIGLATALLIPLLFAISIAVVPLCLVAVGLIFLVPVVLFLLGSNAFGIRRKQARMYASSFAATQPYGTAQLAGLKVLVRSGCVLAALIAVGVSMWISSSLLSAWGAWVDGKQEPILGWLILRHEIGETFAGLTGYALISLAVIASVTVVMTVALLAARDALRVRYPRPLFAAHSLLLLWWIAFILLGVAERNGTASEFVVNAIFEATRWITAAGIVLTTVYLFWSGFVERVLTLRYVCGAFVISVAFAAAWVAALEATGKPATNAIALMLSLPLLPLMVSALAPWSLSRVRHM